MNPKKEKEPRKRQTMDEWFKEELEKAFQQGRTQERKRMEEVYKKVIYEDLSPEQLLGVTLFFRRIMGFKDRGDEK